MVSTTKLANTLSLSECPHCGVDSPYLQRLHNLETINHEGKNKRIWVMYACRRCGGMITAFTHDADHQGNMHGYFPGIATAPGTDPAIPARAREYLAQAAASRQAPAGAVILAASAVDAMLKGKGYTSGSLYSRIDQAAKDQVITDGMAKWAHAVRLDANDQRHSDEDAPLPGGDDAQRSIAFAAALAEFMYVLPARVSVGIDEAKR
jgi:hypothetical protein